MSDLQTPWQRFWSRVFAGAWIVFIILIVGTLFVLGAAFAVEREARIWGCNTEGPRP